MIQTRHNNQNFQQICILLNHENSPWTALKSSTFQWFKLGTITRIFNKICILLNHENSPDSYPFTPKSTFPDHLLLIIGSIIVFHLSKLWSKVLHTRWGCIFGEAAGEVWNYSFFIVKELKLLVTVFYSCENLSITVLGNCYMHCVLQEFCFWQGVIFMLPSRNAMPKRLKFNL